ncbi:MAG TPA: T9SS type A sorting domain-containing protein, partial [candidate division Zixibacteria bacterium]
SPIDSNFRINDDGAGNKQTEPAVTMDCIGDFVITWRDERYFSAYGSEIYAQRYYSNGAAFGYNFYVNDDVGNNDQDHPEIAADSIGNFVIAWEDKRLYSTFRREIFAQRYNYTGTPLLGNFPVNNDVDTADQKDPAVAADALGNFVITWEDGRNWGRDIYAQKYSFAGSGLGPNFRVDDASPSDQSEPDVARDYSGRFAISWKDDRNGADGDVLLQKYDSSGTTVGSIIQVNDDASGMAQRTASVAMDSSGNLVLVWQDYRNAGELDFLADIYAQRLNWSGFLGSNFKVNADTASAYQLSPVVTTNGHNDFVIAWEDWRNNLTGKDVYAAAYNSSGTALGSNFKVGTYAADGEETSPDVAMNRHSNFVVTWNVLFGGYSGGDYDIYAQRFSFPNLPSDSSFRVNDDGGSDYQFSPATAMDSAGDFVIVWVDNRSGYYWDVFAQRYGPSGSALGSNFEVTSDPPSATQNWPRVAMSASGGFVVVWEDDRDGDEDIYAQRYNGAGVAQDSNFKVNNSSALGDQKKPDVTRDYAGNFVIVWQDERSYSTLGTEIYCRRYDSSGSPLEEDFRVNDDGGKAEQSNPQVASDSAGNFVVTWQDYRNDQFNYDVYAQRFDSEGNRIEDNYPVANSGFRNFGQEMPTCAVTPSDVFFAWQDNRRAKGWDIYAKVVGWDWSVVEEEPEVNLPVSFELSQNYPNPFNPTTTIHFTVFSPQSTVHSPILTTLKIYNILGEKVVTLVDEFKGEGSYTVIWDGKDEKGEEVASGIYFYRLKMGEYSKAKKMLLLR